MKVDKDTADSLEAAHAAASAVMREFCQDCPNCGKCPQPCKFYNDKLAQLMAAPPQE